MDHFDNFYSKFVDFRNVDVWFPPGYDQHSRYPVLYMHDGQNLFNNPATFGGESWRVDQAMTRLIEEGKIRGAIVVGIWNSSNRWRDYLPQKPYESPDLQKHHPFFLERIGEPPLSDAYLKFLVEELKPYIDSKYRTLPDRQNTFVMGSSMGGLISLYAICEYPQVFGGAGCVSTHWPAGRFDMVDELARRLPDPATHRLYFDFGTETLDAEYEPFQRRWIITCGWWDILRTKTGLPVNSKARNTPKGRGASGFTSRRGFYWDKSDTRLQIRMKDIYP
jgi:predicted alpha/beta superfamily hydrolase